MKGQTKLKEILEHKSMAVVGFSPKEERPSNYVSMYMQKSGYLITPVNPGHQQIGNLNGIQTWNQSITQLILSIFLEGQNLFTILLNHQYLLMRRLYGCKILFMIKWLKG